MLDSERQKYNLLSQILEHCEYCITLAKGKKRKLLGHVFTLSRAYESCLACHQFILKLLIGLLPRE